MGGSVKHVRWCSDCGCMSTPTEEESRVEEEARRSGWVIISEDERFCPECRAAILRGAALIILEEEGLREMHS